MTISSALSLSFCFLYFEFLELTAQEAFSVVELSIYECFAVSNTKTTCHYSKVNNKSKIQKFSGDQHYKLETCIVPCACVDRSSYFYLPITLICRVLLRLL